MKIPAFSLPVAQIAGGESGRISTELFYKDGTPINIEYGTVVGFSIVDYVNQWRYSPIIYKRYELTPQYIGGVVTTDGGHYIVTADSEYRQDKTYYIIVEYRDALTPTIIIEALEYTYGADEWDQWKSRLYEQQTPIYVWVDTLASGSAHGSLNVLSGDSGIMNKVVFDLDAEETQLLHGKYLYQITVDNEIGTAESQGIIIVSE